MTDTTRPDVDWDEVAEEGLLCLTYVDDNDDLLEALQTSWDDTRAAAHKFATAETSSRSFNAETYFAGVVSDFEAMRLAYETMQHDADDADQWPQDWQSMIERLVYWVVYDRFHYCLVMSKSNIHIAVKNGTLATTQPALV